METKPQQIDQHLTNMEIERRLTNSLASHDWDRLVRRALRKYPRRRNPDKEQNADSRVST